MPLGIKEKTTINSINDLLDAVRKAKTNKQDHVRMWYRGQSDLDWALKPGVYRSPPFPNKEEDIHRQECHLTQDFRVESASVVTHPFDEVELYFVQQHYRLPTRLLDWSGSPLAALYFACEKVEVVDPSDPKKKIEQDGAVFVMDAYQLGEDQKSKPKYQGTPTSRHPRFRKAVRNIVRWKEFSKVKYPDYIMAVRPDHFDSRVSSQRSYFTFHVPKRSELTTKENSTLHWLKVPAANKRKLREELFLLNVDEFSIYRDLDHLSQRLKYAYGLL